MVRGRAKREPRRRPASRGQYDAHARCTRSDVFIGRFHARPGRGNSKRCGASCSPSAPSCYRCRHRGPDGTVYYDYYDYYDRSGRGPRSRRDQGGPGRRGARPCCRARRADDPERRAGPHCGPRPPAAPRESRAEQRGGNPGTACRRHSARRAQPAGCGCCQCRSALLCRPWPPPRTSG